MNDKNIGKTSSTFGGLSSLSATPSGFLEAELLGGSSDATWCSPFSLGVPSLEASEESLSTTLGTDLFLLEDLASCSCLRLDINSLRTAIDMSLLFT